LNVQAICDARTRFLGVSIVCSGSCHDSVAYGKSEFPQQIAKLPGLYHIVADAAYPESEQVLCPYPGRGLGVYEDSYNYHQSQVRMAVERSFGILVARWGVLWRPLRSSLETSVQTVRACMILHTYCIEELPEADLGVLGAVLDKQGQMPSNFQTGDEGKANSSPTGVCVLREVIKQQLEARQQRRPN
jgi:hypothetical protein